MAGVGQADQVKLDQYFTSVREMENQLAIELQKPEHCEACVVPAAPKEVAGQAHGQQLGERPGVGADGINRR